MDKYELTIVLPAGTTAAKIKSVKADLDSLVKVSKGSVLSENNWGEKALAYEVDGNSTGVFLHYLLELPSDQVKNVDHKMVHNAEILRHLMVKEEVSKKKKEKSGKKSESK